MNISNHITLLEATKSLTAIRKGIDNTPGQKLKWQNKCLAEMRRVNEWLEQNNEKIEEFSTIEFIDNETIEEWSKRIKDGTETILPGV